MLDRAAHIAPERGAPASSATLASIEAVGLGW